jgi:hypothetical protein
MTTHYHSQDLGRTQREFLLCRRFLGEGSSIFSEDGTFPLEETGLHPVADFARRPAPLVTA